MSTVQESTLVDLSPADIHPHPDNPRHDAAADAELVASIASIGIIEPLVVRWVNIPTDPEDPDGEHIAFYELIAGHRRLDAATKVGLLSVPCFVKDFDDAQALEAMLVENLARRDLDPIEEANGLQRLSELGHKPKTLAAKLGRSVEHIKGRLSLLELPDEYQDKVSDGSLSLKYAEIAAQLRPEVLAEIKPARRFDPWTLESKLIEQKNNDALAKVTKKLTKAGTAFVQRGAQGVKYIGGGWNYLNVDETLHGFEPCHVVVLSVYKGEVVQDPGCADPERHSGKGKGKSKLKIAEPEDVESSYQAQRAAQHEARRAEMTDEERAADDERLARIAAEAAEREAAAKVLNDLVAARIEARNQVFSHKVDEIAALDYVWNNWEERLQVNDDPEFANLVGLKDTNAEAIEEWRTKNKANRITALAALVALEEHIWNLRTKERLPLDTFLEAHGIAPPAVVTEADEAHEANKATFKELAIILEYPDDVIEEVLASDDREALVDAVVELTDLVADRNAEADEAEIEEPAA